MVGEVFVTDVADGGTEGQLCVASAMVLFSGKAGCLR